MVAPEISVVVSTYERASELARVLEGFRLQTFRDFEVVVADDGSGPDTRAVVERFRPHLTIEHAWHPHDGFRAAAARNMGVRASRGSWIVFCDGDCIPFPTYLEEHARARGASVFLAGERYLLEKTEADLVTTDAVSSRQAFDHAPPRERRRLVTLAAKNAFYRITRLKPERPKLLTSNCSVSRDALVAVNGLDERFQGWGREDDDLRRRLVRHGLRPRSVVGKANLLHLWHAPVASFKGTVRAGPNEPYFQRGFFLTRCRAGLERVPLRGLSVAVSSDDGAAADLARRILFGGAASPRRDDAVQVEVLVDAGTATLPRFTRDAEVRVLVQAGPPAARRVSGAHVLLHGGPPVEGAISGERGARLVRALGVPGLGPDAFERAAAILDETL